MLSFLANAYMVIGIFFLMAVLLESKTGLIKKLFFVVFFGLSVLWLQKVPNVDLWLWKLKMYLNL